jgi:hypothetical protein
MSTFPRNSGKSRIAVAGSCLSGGTAWAGARWSAQLELVPSFTIRPFGAGTVPIRVSVSVSCERFSRVKVWPDVGGSRSFEMRTWTQEKRQVAGFLVVWKVGIEF